MTAPTGHPLRQGGIRLVRTQSSTILVDETEEKCCELNDSAAALWELCDGRTSTTEMVDAICLLCDVSRDVVERDVTTALDALSTAGVIRWAP